MTRPLIFTDFAPNESIADSICAIKLLFRPWQWMKGQAVREVNQFLARIFLPNHIFITYLSGRAGLLQLFYALSLQPDSYVLVPAFTCEAVVLPIIQAGLKPQYVDIETKTFSLDIADLKKKYIPAVKAIVIQHTFGYKPIYRQEILDFAREKNLVVIEDLAHGGDFLSLDKDINTIKLLSFGRSKIVSSVFGGAIAIHDSQLATKLKRLNLLLKPPSHRFILLILIYKIVSPAIKTTAHLAIGKILWRFCRFLGLLTNEISTKEKRGEFDKWLTKSLPNALAILLIEQLKRYYQKEENRKQNVKYYLKNLPSLLTKNQLANPQALLRFPILVPNRQSLIKQAKNNGIFLGRWYEQVVAPKDLPLYKVDYLAGSCPTAERVCQHIVNLPTNTDLQTVKRICNFINHQFS